MESKKIIKISLIIIIILILIDQVSKICLDIFLTKDINLISDILVITKVENEGIAFGINKQNFVNIILSVAILIFIVNYIINQKANLNIKILVFLDLILAGGISNLLDRIFKGAVFDFIKVGDFPVFNIADCCIVIGWILFVINFVFFSTIEIKAAMKK
ncbi:MAG: signal peptidase II [Clostridia bacterium]|nr:signal peptidase II [Clostridia bacterium]